MRLSHKESVFLFDIYREAKKKFDMKKCLRKNKDKDDSTQYCNKMKYYVENQLGWPRNPETIKKQRERLKDKGKDPTPLS